MEIMCICLCSKHKANAPTSTLPLPTYCKTWCMRDPCHQDTQKITLLEALLFSSHWNCFLFRSSIKLDSPFLDNLPMCLALHDFSWSLRYAISPSNSPNITLFVLMGLHITIQLFQQKQKCFLPSHLQNGLTWLLVFLIPTTGAHARRKTLVAESRKKGLKGDGLQMWFVIWERDGTCSQRSGNRKGRGVWTYLKITVLRIQIGRNDQRHK